MFQIVRHSLQQNMQAKPQTVTLAETVHVTIVRVMPLQVVNGLKTMQILPTFQTYVVTATMKHVLPIVKKQAYHNMHMEQHNVPDAEQPYIRLGHVTMVTHKAEILVLLHNVTTDVKQTLQVAEHLVLKVGH